MPPFVPDALPGRDATPMMTANVRKRNDSFVGTGFTGARIVATIRPGNQPGLSTEIPVKLSFKFLAVSVGLACAAGTVQAEGLKLTKGLYKCELNRTVDVTDVAPDNSTATIKWGKRPYVLKAVPARTGALRYEDVESGLTWLVIVGK